MRKDLATYVDQTSYAMSTTPEQAFNRFMQEYNGREASDIKDVPSKKIIKLIRLATDLKLKEEEPWLYGLLSLLCDVGQNCDDPQVKLETLSQIDRVLGVEKGENWFKVHERAIFGVRNIALGSSSPLVLGKAMEIFMAHAQNSNHKKVSRETPGCQDISESMILYNENFEEALRDSNQTLYNDLLKNRELLKEHYKTVEEERIKRQQEIVAGFHRGH